MALSGNKGEWSEIYALLKLLAEGQLFAADEQLNRLNDMFFPILKVIREEVKGRKYEYRVDSDNAVVKVYLNEQELLSIPERQFNEEATRLFKDILGGVSGNGTFSVPATEAFIHNIYVNKLKAPSANKSDIDMQIHDVNTGYEKIVGFSIKSELGMAPTLLNAGRTTNFVYKVSGLDFRHIDEVNSIDTPRKIKDRIRAIRDHGGQLVFSEMENAVFNENLIMIDSHMPQIVAEMLVSYYSETASDCSTLLDCVIRKNPLSRSAEFYKHKIKEMLCAIALGMTPATVWDGTDEATGGYIVVKTNGEVLAYHIYNRDAFRGYLLKNTKFESASSSRHQYGVLYEENGEIFIKLNLQIRFR
jgi:hypothetical protein